MLQEQPGHVSERSRSDKTVESREWAAIKLWAKEHMSHLKTLGVYNWMQAQCRSSVAKVSDFWRNITLEPLYPVLILYNKAQTNMGVIKAQLLVKQNLSALQCSCLENPRDGGAWWAAVYGVAQSRTRLKQLSSSRPTGCKLSSWHW